jgi:hypothetical protein
LARRRQPRSRNGHLGWLPARDVTLGRVDWSLSISLRRRSITVRDGNRVLARYRTAVGAPGAPTPVGRFAHIPLGTPVTITG